MIKLAGTEFAGWGGLGCGFPDVICCNSYRVPSTDTTRVLAPVEYEPIRHMALPVALIL